MELKQVFNPKNILNFFQFIFHIKLFKEELPIIFSKKSFKPQFITKKGLPDMRYKENRKVYCSPGCNVDGSLDLRLKINRNKF